MKRPWVVTARWKKGKWNLCGIFGWALARAKSESHQTLSCLTDMMAHRGPDGAGQWVGDTADGQHQIAFGHRRLSIIDLGGGVQPMTSSDGTITLITNGEIYNYIELRQVLRGRGHIFRTESDTEVLLEAYRAWGNDALSRLQGMFAFALWDSRAQKLLLGRDAFGKKPLFIANASGGVLFGSEIEPLLSFPGMSREIEPSAVSHYLLNRYVPGPLTFFQSVRKLQPGCYAEWRKGRISITRYFTPPIASIEPDLATLENAVEAFESTFNEAVHIRMRSDAPYGAYLSGGIDSSAVVATMAQFSSGPVRTFSVGFREPAYSELDHARTIAQRFGTVHEELVIESRSFMEKWPEAIVRRGAPVSESSDIPILMLSHAARGSVKMVLTGEGSDEFLGGYPKHQAESWIRVYQHLVPPAINDLIVGPAVRALPYSMRRLKILAGAASERNVALRLRMWFGGLNSAERDLILGSSASIEPPDQLPFSAHASSALRRMLLFDQTSWLPDNLLERGDRMMMAGSIEGRMPFMDTELAKVAARIPDQFLIGARGGKRVLRAVMRKVLPSEILQRRKIGFRVPIHAWFRGEYRAFVHDMLTSDGSRVARLCNGRYIHKLVTEHIEGRQNNERVLWSLINLEMFFRTFKPVGTEFLISR